MHTPAANTGPLGLTPQQYDRLVNEAKREALRLRREAAHEWMSTVSGWLGSVLHRAPHHRLEA
jgi:hypothetical protein